MENFEAMKIALEVDVRDTAVIHAKKVCAHFRANHTECKDNVALLFLCLKLVKARNRASMLLKEANSAADLSTREGMKAVSLDITRDSYKKLVALVDLYVWKTTK